jgi:thiamine-monophosphate kinase
MMDLSDGLAKDLPRLAAASGLGFEIDPALLPCNEGCTPAEAWGDGEDYELLLTLPEPVLPEALEHWKKAFPGVLLTKIGRMAAEGQGSAPDLAPKGWDHFAT